MSTKKIICLILTFLLLLVCVASCQAANAGITTQEQAADRQSSDAPAETVSYGKDSSDRTEAEASHTKNVTEDVLPSEPDPASEGETMIYAHIGDKTLTIRPEDNSSAKAFVELLQGGDRTIDMHDYGGFEKVGPLGTTLPTNDERITTEPGDVILYQGNQITIYYDINTWSFTRLGKVQGMSPEEIRDTLGDGDPTVVFSLKQRAESTPSVGKFDFETRTVLLNSGHTMPILGLGTYALDHDTCVNSVKALLQNGGRLIDTAYMYHNEEAVGEGVRQAMEEYGIPREDIFVITKLYPNQFSDPEAAIDMALQKLDIGYIDMMLLHHPGTDDVEAYKAMESYVEQGKIRSLGLSN